MSINCIFIVPFAMVELYCFIFQWAEVSGSFITKTTISYCLTSCFDDDKRIFISKLLKISRIFGVICNWIFCRIIAVPWSSRPIRSKIPELPIFHGISDWRIGKRFLWQKKFLIFFFLWLTTNISNIIPTFELITNDKEITQQSNRLKLKAISKCVFNWQ